MMNEKSYTELMKTSAMNRTKSKEHFVQNLYIDMMLEEICLKAEKERLLIKIDQAIDSRNKEQFIELTNQLKEINKKFGT